MKNGNVVAVTPTAKARYDRLRMSAAFQPITPGDCFEFDPDCVLDCDYGPCLHFKSRQG